MKTPQDGLDEYLHEHLHRSTATRMGDPQVRSLALWGSRVVDPPRRRGRRAGSLIGLAFSVCSPRTGRSTALWGRVISGARAWWRDHFKGALDPDLPTFVERDKGPQVLDWMRRARETGGLLVLVGDSGVGKTRLLYEAARQVLPDYAVLSPDPGDGGVVNALGDARRSYQFDPYIIWLDELQRFLPGPYFIRDDQAGHTPINDYAIRNLLYYRSSTIILGTLSPAHVRDLSAIGIDPDLQMRLPLHEEARMILNFARLSEFGPLETFSDPERAAALVLAARDPRLADAHGDPGYNVTEALAGAGQLMRRYHQGSHEQRAIVHAAVDARRLGIHAFLTTELLHAAACGYLTAAHTDGEWFAHALTELTGHSSLQDRAPTPLFAVPNAAGYTIAEFLLQQLTRQREHENLPDETWQALVDHTHDSGDIRRLADSAAGRLLYRYAEPLYRRLADAGDGYASDLLADLLVEQGRIDEAIAVLKASAAGGRRKAGRRLTSLMAKHDRFKELQALADTRDWDAVDQLAKLLVDRGRPDEAITVLQTYERDSAPPAGGALHHYLVRLLAEQGRAEDLRALADTVTGSGYAAQQLAKLLAEQGRTEDLRALADAGSWGAVEQLAKLLARQGNLQEAIAIWQARVDAGEKRADDHLFDLLIEYGRTDEAVTVLRKRANTGDFAIYRMVELLAGRGHDDEIIIILQTFRILQSPRYAIDPLAKLLAGQGRIDEAIDVYRRPAELGDHRADERLAELLAEHGRIEELQARADAGNSTASWQLAKLRAMQGHDDREGGS